MSKKQAQEPTVGERNFVKTVLLKGEDPLYIKWATKRKRDKVQDRLVVVGRFRIFSIKKTLTGKKQIQRVGHLFDVTGLYSSDTDRLIVRFKDFEIDVQEPGAGSDLLTIIREALQVITFGFASYALPQITLLPQERVLKQLPAVDTGIANGLLKTYEAYCDYYNQPPSKEFNKFVAETVDQGSTDLNMENCPGMERKVNAIDFLPIRAALRHNTYFTSFSLKNIARRDVATSIADTMLHNMSLQKLVLSGIDSPDAGIILLGASLKKNSHNQLTELDLSFTPKLKDNGCVGLAEGLKDMNHGLLKLNLAVCGIGSKGITALMQAFCAGRDLASQIVELDLSRNPLGQAGSVGLTNWFNQEGAGQYLRYLILSHTKLEVALVMKAMRNRQISSLIELDLSGNRIDPTSGQAIAAVIEINAGLKTLNLSNCQMQAPAVAAIAQACANNNAIQDLTLNLGNNMLAVPGAATLAQLLGSSNAIGGLLVSGCGFKKEGMMKIAEALGQNQSIKMLDVSYNLHSGTATKMEKVLSVLAQAVAKHPKLQHLALVGDNNKLAIGKEIHPLLECLKSNPGFTELDISGNKIGDQLAVSVCDALRSNNKLKSLLWDRNSIGIGGWQALLNVLTTNRSLVYCPPPKDDMERSIRESKNKESYAIRLKELMDGLQDTLKKNAGGKGYVSEYLKVRQGRSYTRLAPAPVPPQPGSPSQQPAYAYNNGGGGRANGGGSVSGGFSYSPPPSPGGNSNSGYDNGPTNGYSTESYDNGSYDNGNYNDGSYDNGSYDNGSYEEQSGGSSPPPPPPPPNYPSYDRASVSLTQDYSQQEFDDASYETTAPPPPPPPPF